MDQVFTVSIGALNPLYYTILNYSNFYLFAKLNGIDLKWKK